MRSLAALALLLLGCATTAVPARPEPPALAHFDVYGSKVTRAAIVARYGDALARVLGDPATARALAERIEREGDFAYAHLSRITYAPGVTYATLDLVDREDAARRLRFTPTPTGPTHADPEDVLAGWDAYEAAFPTYIAAKTVDWKAPCPYWHCIAIGHPALAAMMDDLAHRAARHPDELADILLHDPRALWRARAAYVIALLPDGARVVELELARLRDAEELVRNNTMRVLAMIALHHPELAIPVAPIVDALDLPATDDRNKASATLAGLATHPENRAAILRAGDTLLAMLALRQPNNHDFAHRILVALAGRDLGEHDVDAWRAWLHAQR